MLCKSLAPLCAAVLLMNLPAAAQYPGPVTQQPPPEQMRPRSTEVLKPPLKPAQPPEQAPAEQLGLAESICAAPVPQTQSWLMARLDQTRAARPLHALGLNIGGWLEQGFTWNPDSPDNRSNFPITFNDRANEYQMNQLYLFVERPIDPLGCCWDIGGRVDLLYGTDYYFVEADGLEREQNGAEKWNSEDGPRWQFGPARMYGLAMPQAYVEVFAPIGSGVSLKLGHFYTILGYESPRPLMNFFYSHSLMFQYAQPITHTGALASYRIGDQIRVYSGLTLGWDNFSNPNDGLAYISRVEWTSCDQRTTVVFASSFGDDSMGVDYEVDRYFYTVMLSRKIGERLVVAGKWDWGHDKAESTGSVLEDLLLEELGVADVEWYGAMIQAVYEINRCWAAGVRLEWMRDDNNVRIIPAGGFVEGANYWAVTVGLNYSPHPNLLIRPELRWDWSDMDLRAIDLVGAYDDFSDKNQFTAAVDAIIAF